MSYVTFLSPVEGAVRREREAQDAKWGPQDHADGTGPDTVWAFTGPASHVSATARAECNRLLDEGLATFRDIALEEVAEAFAEDDPGKLRTELIQCAAVFQMWAEAIDRRAAKREQA